MSILMSFGYPMSLQRRIDDIGRVFRILVPDVFCDYFIIIKNQLSQLLPKHLY